MRFKLIPMLALMLAICILLYMTLGAKGSWSFILPFRGGKLVALLVVAVSVSSATVLFQTVSGNRILTPSIMGFDALYMLILTGMVFFLGAQSTLRLPQEGVFVLNAGMMMIASLALFGTLINQDRGDILRMILTGLIFATLFRSLTTFAQNFETSEIFRSKLLFSTRCHCSIHFFAAHSRLNCRCLDPSLAHAAQT